MRLAAAIAAWLAAAPAVWGDGLPALHDVTGVSGDDVLNIRAAPDAGSAVIGTLPPDAAGIEVTALSPDGRWGLVNSGEQSGYVALRYLRPRPGPGWQAMETPVRCTGTEPFWSLHFDPAARALSFERMGEGSLRLALRSAQPVSGRSDAIVWQFDGPFEGTGQAGSAVLRALACTDGMTDRAYGLDLMLLLPGNGPGTALSGCCSLAP